MHNKTDNVHISHRIRETTVAVEKQLVLHNMSVCLFVAFVIQREKRMRNIVICGLSGCTIFFHIIS